MGKENNPLGSLIESKTEDRVVTEDGKTVRTFSCREQIYIPLDCAARSLPIAPESNSEPSEDSEKYGGRVIEGTASSTSVDSYGTEMSREALLRMQAQMDKGIPLLPRHNNGPGRPVEWDEVIGLTVRADVERSEVVGAADGTEPQYVLRVTSELYDDDDTANKLLKRLELGQTVGQSIGGWFLSVRVITNADDEIERVIVDDLELDHLALTRAPANPDSNGLYHLRSKLQGAIATSLECKSEPELELDRAVTEFAALPCAPIEEKWDWSTEAQNELLGADGDNWERYKKAHLWFDPENQEVKSGYKLPIARMFGNELKVVFRAVSAAMAALNGARGGVDIPENEREKVYDHLVRYYSKFDKEPPSLQSILENIDMENEKTDAAEAVELVEDTEENSPNGVIESSELDETNETVQDEHIEVDLSVTPTDAQGSAVRANPTTPINSGAETMSDETISKFEEMLNRTLGGLVERVQALEERAAKPVAEEAAPVTTAPVEEVESVEQRLKAAEDALRSLAEQPIRRGLAATETVRAGVGATTQFESMVARAREHGVAENLCEITDRHKSTLAEENGMNKLSVNQLRDLLSAGLRAGQKDGLVGKTTAKWQ